MLTFGAVLVVSVVVELTDVVVAFVVLDVVVVVKFDGTVVVVVELALVMLLIVDEIEDDTTELDFVAFVVLVVVVETTEGATGAERVFCRWEERLNPGVIDESETVMMRTIKTVYDTGFKRRHPSWSDQHTQTVVDVATSIHPTE
jgi:hypothetical protein